MYGAVTVGERGQIVIPAQLRKAFDIKTGEKLIVCAKPGGPIGLFPEDHFTSFLEQTSSMLTKINQAKSLK